MPRLGFAVSVCLLAVALAACNAHSVQTTSGSRYLAHYKPPSGSAARATEPAGADQPEAQRSRPEQSVDALVRQAAAIEPLLEFPAHIGLARIEDGKLTGLPPHDFALWTAVAERYPHLGRFSYVEPLVAEYGARIAPNARRLDVIDRIRLGAARQHMDAVLVYEVSARSTNSATLLSILNITLIAPFVLPNRGLDAVGEGRALLLDVRNGYPYGTASTMVDLSSFTHFWRASNSERELHERAAKRVVTELVPEVEAMFGKLVAELDAKRRVDALAPADAPPAQDDAAQPEN